MGWCGAIIAPSRSVGGMVRAAQKHISACVNLFKHDPLVKPDQLALIWNLDQSFLASHMPPFGVF